MKPKLSPEKLLGPEGPSIAAAMKAALAFLGGREASELLPLVGQRIEDVPALKPVDKSALQDSFGGSQTDPPDDLLAGRGMFYVTERGRLCLDCTSGHYQMLWGYHPPALLGALSEAVASGIVWDNHCNVPQAPVKQLAHRLVEVGSAPGSADPLDTVLLGCATGSVACAAALKIQLLVHERDKGGDDPPVVVVLDGNYHGTDVMAQHLRGMWGRYVRNLHVRAVQPNDAEELRGAFDRFGRRVAGFWAEPVLMNREAVVVDGHYLHLARELCDSAGALMCIDEIQTGFWQPEVFAYRALGLAPDLVVAGKGMTAGFHPQAAVLLKSRHDVLATYDAISTNGSAPLPCYLALCCLEMVASQAGRIAAVGDRYADGMHAIAREFPEALADARGLRHMMGLKFHRVDDALDFHRRAVAAGLWVRVHAYHEGHSTLLTKLPLCADEAVVDFLLAKFRSLLRSRA